MPGRHHTEATCVESVAYAPELRLAPFKFLPRTARGAWPTTAAWGNTGSLQIVSSYTDRRPDKNVGSVQCCNARAWSACGAHALCKTNIIRPLLHPHLSAWSCRRRSRDMRFSACVRERPIAFVTVARKTLRLSEHTRLFFECITMGVLQLKLPA